jgi:hypothetical protein
MSAYYAPTAGASAKAADPQTPTPVPFTFGESAPQARLTVAFRLLAALPQLIVLAVLGVAAYVVTIIGWFAALFTGRLPAFAADFLAGYLRWMARVYAYAFLLTDVYPPFSLADADYPVRVAVTPGPLNRLAVLFRFFLMIPCWIVTTVISYGAFTIVQLVSWLIVLISGRMPNALHEALAATLRYQLRTAAFGLMLTSAYPGGLFGEPKYSLSQWPLVLSAGARKLLGVFIVLGVLLAVGGGVAAGVVLSQTGHSAASAKNQVLADAAPAISAIGNYPTNLKACTGSLSCVTALDRKVGATLGTFAQQLPSIAMPSAKAEAADKAMASSASGTAAIFDRIGTATTPTQYEKLAGSAGVDASVSRLNQAYINLGNALTS